MKMYPDLDVYHHYLSRVEQGLFSSTLPDRTKKATLTFLNHAINACEKWDHVVDIGGGSGHYLAALAAKFKTATLVEAEHHAEHDHYKNRHQNIEVVQAYIENFTPTKKADFILLADLFEHIHTIGPFIEKVASLQETGGVVYIMTPNPLRCGPVTESGLYYKRFTERSHNGHVRHYFMSEVIAAMKNAGYTLVFTRYEEAPLRQRTKRIMYALSRRDRAWRKHLFYLPLRPLLLLFALPLFRLLEYYTYQDEMRHQHDELVTITQNLVFKKAHGA